MSFIPDPNAGPSPKIPEGGVVYDAALADTSTVLSKTVVSHQKSTGLVIYITCDQDGDFTIRYINKNNRIQTLQASTPYTASAGTRIVYVEFYVREAYVEFTPDAAASNLSIEIYSYGRGQ